MSRSVARDVAVRGSALVAASLLVVGLATGGVLHWQARASLDRALLATAHGQAHPAAEEAWEAEHSRAPAEAFVVEPGDPRVPESFVAWAEDAERPVFFDHHGDRFVLLPVESDDHGEDEHRIVAAQAPAVTLGRSVGAFALIYGLFASVVTVLASAALFATVRAAFAPMARARREASSVLSLGQGLRLTAAAPDEIADLLVAVNALLDRLDAASAAQGRFTAEAAHELRTPVTAIQGEIDVLLRHPRSAEDYRAALVSVREEVDRLGRIVQSLLALARIDAGEAGRSRELVRANEIAAAAVAAERATLDRAGCALSVVVTDDPEIEGNAPLLELAVANLLRNAARHAPGAPVSLTVAQSDGHASFTVDDGGPGIPADVAASVFDRFARGPDARRRDPGGLGLGLPLAREVARRHGGDCRVEAGPRGARVVLTVATPAPGA